MNDLRIVPPRPASSRWGWGIAILVLAAAAFAIFYFNPHRVADLKVVGSTPFSPHTVFEAMEGPAAPGTHILGTPTQASEDDLYVVIDAALKNDLRIPIFLNGGTLRVALSGGAVTETSMLSISDLKRLELLFPALPARVHNPIADGEEIAPGETRTGSVIFAFPGQSASAWATHKNGALTLSLRNQGPQTAPVP